MFSNYAAAENAGSIRDEIDFLDRDWDGSEEVEDRNGDLFPPRCYRTAGRVSYLRRCKVLASVVLVRWMMRVVESHRKQAAVW